MNWNFEVNAWDGPVDGPYYWLTIYTGSSIIKALYYLWWAKRNGWSRIKLECKPQ